MCIKMAQFTASSVSRAIINDNIEELQKLIDENKRIDIPDNRGYTPLHLAIDKDSIQIVNVLLKHEDLEIDNRTYEGFTPLLLACAKSQPNFLIIKALLDLNADVNATNTENITSLHFACKAINIDLVRVLLDYGASINCQDFNGYTPLHYALEQKSLNLVTFLLENNANANITELHGLNALMFAIVFARHCVDVIMPRITDLRAVAADRKSAIGLACATQNIPVVRKLLELGANDRVKISFSYGNENSAFRICAKMCNLELFKIVWHEILLSICNGNPLHKDNAIYEFIQCWGVTSVEPYEYLFCPDLVLGQSPGTFIEALVRQHKPPFDTHKENLFRIASLFLNYRVTSCEYQLITIMRHYGAWKYSSDFMGLIVVKARPIYTPVIILQASLYSDKMAHYLLKYCYVVDCNIFKLSCYTSEIYNIKFFLKYFTPKYDDGQKVLADIRDDSKYDDVRDIINCNKVPSLKELCRDKFRRELFNRTDYDREFFNIIEGLEVPNVIKDILLFREPLYNHSENN